MKQNKKYWTVLLLTSGLCIWNIVYLPSYFYVPFQEAFQLTHEQMGTLLSMYGVLAVLGYFFGGMIADRFSPKLLMVVSNLSTGALGLYMATFPSYRMLLVIYMAFGVTAVFLYWSAFIKSLRLMGTDDEQGKLFGWFESFYGLVSIVLSYAILLAFSSYISNNGHFEYVIISYSLISIVIGILIAVLYKPSHVAVVNAAKEEKFDIRSNPKALKLPITWINSIIVFSLFVIISGASYLNPYLNSTFLVPVTWATALGITIKYGFRIVTSPIGGALVDRYKRSSRVLIAISTLIAITGLVLLLVPQEPSYLVPAVIVVFLFCIVLNLSRSCMYVPVAEAKVPVEILGTVVGIVSAIGYSSDIYIWKIFGNLLDSHGNRGYSYIIAVMIGSAVLALVTSMVYDRYLTAQEKQGQAPSSGALADHE